MALFHPGMTALQVFARITLIAATVVSVALPPLWPVIVVAWVFALRNRRQHREAVQRVADQQRVQRELQWREWEQDPTIGLSR
jgi:predicted LPLAT superfamily acyltransferase